MPHKKGGRKSKFSIKKGPREMLIKNLATSVVLYEKVTTTRAKAKAVKQYLDRLLSRAVNSKADKREVHRYLRRHLMHEKAVTKVLEDLKPRLAGKTGGFVSVLGAGFRKGDGAQISVIRLLLAKPVVKETAASAEPAKAPGKTITGKEKVTVKRKRAEKEKVAA